MTDERRPARERARANQARIQAVIQQLGQALDRQVPADWRVVVILDVPEGQYEPGFPRYSIGNLPSTAAVRELLENFLEHYGDDDVPLEPSKPS